MHDEKNASLVEDLSGKTRYALQLNNGCIKIPSGVYFSGDSTLMTWVKFNKLNNFRVNLFSFSNYIHSFNILCDAPTTFQNDEFNFKIRCIFSLNNKNLISAEIECNNLNRHSFFAAECNEWIHLSLVFGNNSLRLYLNNSLKAKTKFEMFKNEYFDTNYIGNQYNENIEYLISYDEIKVFERSLNDYELRKQNGFYESKNFNYKLSQTILTSEFSF